MNQESLTNLLSQVQTIVEKYDAIFTLTGEKFNIFRILKVEEKETKHSLILADLFNPNGHHRYRHEFLKLFITMYKERYKNVQGDNSKFIKKLTKFNVQKGYWVTTEFPIVPTNEDATNGGRTDIIIRNENTIIIENKINAVDQENQLKKYHTAFPEAPIFYLTLEGKEPSLSSRGDLEKGNDYVCISYKTDILEWIEKCEKTIPETDLLKRNLKVIIGQYVHLIKYLTHQTLDNKMENEIVKYIAKTSENIKSARLINANWDKVKKEIINQFNNRIINENVSENIGNFTNEKDILTIKFDNWENYYLDIFFTEDNDLNLQLRVKRNDQTSTSTEEIELEKKIVESLLPLGIKEINKNDLIGFISLIPAGNKIEWEELLSDDTLKMIRNYVKESRNLLKNVEGM
jgi:PD-(D/E)XK nuclease superfamily